MVATTRRNKIPPLPENNINNHDDDVISDDSNGDSDGDGGGDNYEKLREKRIKENMEKMQKLGIYHLSHKLKKTPFAAVKRKTIPLGPQRRSSRLETMAPVSYKEIKREKRDNVPKKVKDIVIPEGSNPEFYTEEDEKLLGDCIKAWDINIDGYEEDGNRIYDQVEGKSCHQCRQKTLGLRTNCSKCNRVQGQFCGDCLYTRYGENVIECKEKLDWICPPCRGICNCSRCRRVKGWAPTGYIYRGVVDLGFKSVAHFLIQTRRSKPDSKELGEADDDNDDEMVDNTALTVKEEDKDKDE
ncbi:hypothetical protein ACFE04_002304 [Oxalis oulophora]